jgi:hypothetical protein
MATTQSLLSKEEQAKRLADAKAKADKPVKSKFGSGKATKPEDQKVVPTVQSGDQKAVKTEGEPKAKRKPSATVIAWKALKNFPVDAKITINGDHTTNNPKRRDAARRFSLYKNGMTVGQYLEAAKKATPPISGALANADIRWDVAAGFITVK